MTGICECGCGRATSVAKQTDKARGHVKGQPTRYLVGHSGNRWRGVPIEDRFWALVDASEGDGCWRWLGKIEATGYGRVGVGPKMLMAHRVSYELSKGPIPDGLVVRHTCDNPPCVRPEHLLVGTHRDNARDAVERGRRRRGSLAPAAKLTESQVLEIRRLRAAGLTQYEVADRFGVHRSTIKDIDSGKSWGHLAGAA